MDVQRVGGSAVPAPRTTSVTVVYRVAAVPGNATPSSLRTVLRPTGTGLCVHRPKAGRLLTVTDTPASRSSAASSKPTGPPPATTTSAFMMTILS